MRSTLPIIAGTLAGALVVGVLLVLFVLLPEIRSTQHKLAATQQDIVTTTRESAKQRVKTVEQRCQLTALIADVIKKDDPSRAAGFTKSLVGCEAQLVKVKQIAAEAP